MGDRTILLKFSVSNISYYHMSMFFMNKTFAGKLDKHRRNFFWQRKGGKKDIDSLSGLECVDIRIGGLDIKALKR
jgi:hypothetical protein